MVSSDDEYYTNVGYMFQLKQILPSGGPQIPSQTIIKPIFNNVTLGFNSDMEASALIDSVSFFTQADGLHINMAHNGNYDGSPDAWIVRKSDYIYFSEVEAGQNVADIGYCYPTPKK